MPPKKTIAGGHVYMGNPAKAVRSLSDEDRKATDLGVLVYAELCDRYRAGLERI